MKRLLILGSLLLLAIYQVNSHNHGHADDHHGHAHDHHGHAHDHHGHAHGHHGHSHEEPEANP